MKEENWEKPENWEINKKINELLKKGDSIIFIEEFKAVLMDDEGIIEVKPIKEEAEK